jgi:gliding motility-associated-like protein
VSNPIVSNPIAWNNPPLPTEFIVKTTDILTGCFSSDTVIISTSVVDTAITVSGKLEYCIGDLQPGSLTVNNTSSPVQWYDASGPIAGATGLNYQPTVSGNYWAQVTQLGCLDSTSTYPFLVHALPVADYSPLIDTGCVTSNSRLYTNASTSADGAMTYVWKFSDGDIMQTLDATKTFTSLGAYTIELVTTTQYGCKDSISGVVNIFPNGIPDFIWDSICTNRPMLFTNLSEENASPQVNYTWTFNNGGPVSTLKDPLPVTYTTPGKVDVTLELVALGCANDPKTLTKKVLVNQSTPPVRYPDLTVPLGSSRFIHVRDTVGDIYNWRPPIQLSSYNTPYTEFYSISDDVMYYIDITDEHTCVTTDTMQLLVLKKPGFYLPTAFTPNSDGLNDNVKPYIVGMKAFKSFTVFNRWGNVTFRTSTYGHAWDGKAGGKDQAPGVYVWILEFVTNDDKVVTEKGFITLIR